MAKKAADIRILYLGEKSSLTDYYVIATGLSPPHLKALYQAVQETLKNSGFSVIGAEARQESGWIIIDASDCVVHLFTQEQRDYYQLEALWKDAEMLTADPAEPVFR